MGLKDIQIKNAKWSGHPKGDRLSDEHNLYVLVTKNSKRWRFDYTRPNGKRNTLALGKYPDMGIPGAHKARDNCYIPLLVAVHTVKTCGVISGPLSSRIVSGVPYHSARRLGMRIRWCVGMEMLTAMAAASRLASSITCSAS